MSTGCHHPKLGATSLNDTHDSKFFFSQVHSAVVGLEHAPTGSGVGESIEIHVWSKGMIDTLFRLSAKPVLCLVQTSFQSHPSNLPVTWISRCQHSFHQYTGGNCHREHSPLVKPRGTGISIHVCATLSLPCCKTWDCKSTWVTFLQG